MTEQHVPVERLAAYAAGDLDASAALEVETHVLLCADCRADVAAVQRVSAALAEVEQVPMPADVAARVDAALAAERAADGAGLGAAAAGAAAGDGHGLAAAGDGRGLGAADGSPRPGGDVLPMEAARRRRPSFAGIAAVAAGLALFGAISVPLLTRDSEPTAETQAGSAAPRTTRLASGLDYRSDDPAAALRRALAGGTGDAGLAADRLTRDSAEDAADGPAENAGPTASAAAPAAAGAPPEQPLSATVRRDYSALRTDPARLASCLTALSVDLPDEARKPLVVDFASFEGRPALIVVFPTFSKGKVTRDRVDFWAVGPRCGITPGDDDVMHFARFARPPGL